jgi:hypothetical protein
LIFEPPIASTQLNKQNGLLQQLHGSLRKKKKKKLGLNKQVMVVLNGIALRL